MVSIMCAEVCGGFLCEKRRLFQVMFCFYFARSNIFDANNLIKHITEYKIVFQVCFVFVLGLNTSKKHSKCLKLNFLLQFLPFLKVESLWRTNCKLLSRTGNRF